MTVVAEARDEQATAPELGRQPTRAQESPTGSASRGLGVPAASERIGRYLSIEELGRGGMGRVLRAYDTKLQREVALKVLFTDRIDPRARARMVREARTMARLNHPHVVAVYDVEDEPPHGVVLAMELVKGSTLSQWLAERRRPWGEILAAFVEAGRGLAAAHGEGLLHRDFKPANVLVALGP
jgi:serine/threonine protein kinase